MDGLKEQEQQEETRKGLDTKRIEVPYVFLNYAVNLVKQWKVQVIGRTLYLQ